LRAPGWSRGEQRIALSPSDRYRPSRRDCRHAHLPGSTGDHRKPRGSTRERLRTCGCLRGRLHQRAQKCGGYPTNPPTVIELPFNEADLQTRGNEPYTQVLSDVPAALDSYWSQVFASNGKTYTPLAGTLTPFASGGPYPTCAGQTLAANTVTFCPADGKIYYDNDFLAGPVYSIGDFAVGLLLANAWSQAVQTQLGVTTSGANRALQADCLTGAWAGDLVPTNSGQQKFTLSAGDLDEGLTAFLRYATGGADQVGTLFQQTEAFRQGLLVGTSACGLA
jgi:predicted metalloprotease